MINFLASIPTLQSAIQISGDGGGRIKLDIPENQMDIFQELLMCRGRVLRITIEPENNTNNEDKDDFNLPSWDE